ncbi:MAG: hypothetical protein IJW49_01115 [Clostridia bacterium]|nr:hypothetical protein [Clostridia bacterium]
MEMKNGEYIQLHIGYTFKNRGLLCQAFTRKSYTEKNKNALNNEVLEFYGDKALDFIVMKKMSEYYGHIGAGELFSSSLDEGKLTEIKKKLVCREMLASKVRELDFQHRLLMGKGDIEQRVWEQESVQEDLFEAILGAVAIDSGWNVDALTKVVERMLNPEFYFENGFGDEIDYMQLVQQWHQKKYGQPLKYLVIPGSFSTPLLLEYRNRFGEKITHYRCRIICPPFDEEALGVTKKEAIANAAQKVYENLKKAHLLYSLRDEIGEPDIDRAINQLQELYQKGYISEPQYEYSESHDADGNPIWECHCYLESLRQGFVVTNASKKQAKKIAAYQMVWLYLGEVDNHEA